MGPINITPKRHAPKAKLLAIRLNKEVLSQLRNSHG
jgi:hypothetical protein